MGKIITLLTDFGDSDHYTGALKGAILSVEPDAVIIDITNNAGKYAVASASYMLEASSGYFPAGTVHAAVVDPGVGSKREIIIFKNEKYLYVMPDNGLITCTYLKSKIREIVRVEKEEYFLHPVSSTFHGRDIIAPIAARLAGGADPSLFGRKTSKVILLKGIKAQKRGSFITGRVLHIDRFGNIITGIPDSFRKDFGSKTAVEIGGRLIRRTYENYASAPQGEPFYLWGSSGYLEISLKEASAAAGLSAEIFNAVKVVLR